MRHNLQKSSVALAFLSTLKAGFVEIDNTDWLQKCTQNSCVDLNPVWCKEVASSRVYRSWALSTCFNEIENSFYNNCCQGCCKVFEREGYFGEVPDEVPEESTTSTVKTTSTTTTATEEPITEEPITEELITEKPTTQKSTTQKLTTQKSTTQKSTTQKSSTEKSTTQQTTSEKSTTKQTEPNDDEDDQGSGDSFVDAGIDKLVPRAFPASFPDQERSVRCEISQKDIQLGWRYSTLQFTVMIDENEIHKSDFSRKTEATRTFQFKTKTDFIKNVKIISVIWKKSGFMVSPVKVGTSVAKSDDVFNNAIPGANGPYDIVDKNAAKKGKTTLICKYV